jgi:hypothetical protein
VVGPERHIAFDVDLDARTQRLSLFGRARKQPDRAH